MEPLARPRVLLVGDASARPPGLERALTRGGFQLVEREDPPSDPQADAILITLNHLDRGSLADLLPAAPGQPGSPLSRALLHPGSVMARPRRWLRVPPMRWPPRSTCLSSAPGCTRGSGRPASRRTGQSNRRSSRHRLKCSPTPMPPRDLDRRVQEEFERARRYSLSFSLILLGVDELAGFRANGWEQRPPTAGGRGQRRSAPGAAAARFRRPLWQRRVCHRAARNRPDRRPPVGHSGPGASGRRCPSREIPGRNVPDSAPGSSPIPTRLLSRPRTCSPWPRRR